MPKMRDHTLTNEASFGKKINYCTRPSQQKKFPALLLKLFFSKTSDDFFTTYYVI